MAVTNPFLRGVVNGFLGSPYHKDYKHASKTFTTANFGNAPKFKWLFHVYLEINTTAVTNNWQQVFPEGLNQGLLVKSIDLPKFNIALTEMNQYNRKRYVQTKINYDPIKIVFHDDNANQIRHLWHAYYSYYFNDTNQPVIPGGAPSANNDPDRPSTELNIKNTYSTNITRQKDWGYSGEYGPNNTGFSDGTATGVAGKAPFFKSIRIYGFNQHNYAEYQLINPIIESFAHDQYDYYSNNGVMENQMTLRYETVKYFEGAFNGQNPGAIVKGFANPGVYDTELSPINRPGNNKTIFGNGGLLDAGQGIINDLSKGNVLGALQTAGRLGRTFKNGQDILQTAKREIVKGAIGAIQNPQEARNFFSFPTPGGQNNGASQQVANTNAGATQAPAVPTASNNPISQARPPYQPPTEPGGP